ncbi:MAG: tRNA (N(6)-L-threonylcarbamoyladenosine(37)-C(2))-methylthiotransferase MtaB [Bacteroidales bacterium]|nr:tRNA (N(6)-L-threonylcarbamoyladenosine(37)-C(2))-methylthiotransferase MtaB [Bacteroidales bacterium]
MATKVALHTRGCPMNFAETSTLAGQFQEQGYEQVKFNEKADIYVINTCTVTGEADRKSKRAVRKARKLNPEAIIIAVGCYAQLHPEKIAAMKGVDIVLGNNEKFNILDYLDQYREKERPEIHTSVRNDMVTFHSSYSLGDRTRSFLKVQDGCDYGCAYCTIPLARGKSRNQSIKSLVEEARTIAKSGVQEIILTGINTGDFGRSTGETFQELIRRLENVPGIERYRIASIEPNLLHDDIIRFVSQSEKFLPHFHIPLQSGCNAILAKMKRRYNRELFRDKVKQIKNHMPGAFVGVDVIAGFPGEDEQKFEETYKFLQNLDASFYHVFPFSRRPSTPAVQMEDQVPAEKIKQRSKQLQMLAKRKSMMFYRRHLGEERKVLFEHHNYNGKIFGYTDNYIKIEKDYRPDLAGKIKKVALQQINKQGNVEGKILES